MKVTAWRLLVQPAPWAFHLGTNLWSSLLGVPPQTSGPGLTQGSFSAHSFSAVLPWTDHVRHTAHHGVASLPMVSALCLSTLCVSAHVSLPAHLGQTMSGTGLTQVVSAHMFLCSAVPSWMSGIGLHGAAFLPMLCLSSASVLCHPTLDIRHTTRPWRPLCPWGAWALWSLLPLMPSLSQLKSLPRLPTLRPSLHLSLLF